MSDTSLSSQPSGRQSQRAKLDLYINKFIADEPHLALARDISVSGIFLYKLLEPEVNAAGQFAIEVQLPDTEEIIWALAEPVRTELSGDVAGVGLKFVRISEHDRWLIRNYIASRRN